MDEIVDGTGTVDTNGDVDVRERGGAGAPGARGGTSRRDFLKVLGVAGAGTAAAACSPPETTDRLLPYLVDPEDVTPGERTAYATVLTEEGPEPLPVLALTREGRVVNLEPNAAFPSPASRTSPASGDAGGGTAEYAGGDGTGGGISPLALSSLQHLYDPDRVRGPREGGPDGREVSWEEAIEAVGRAVAGGTTVLLTPGVGGTRDRLYAEWAGAVGAEHLRFELLDHEVERRAHEIVFGEAALPRYALERSDRIVCFGADFLESWLAPSELTMGFAVARDVEAGRHAKFTFVGPRLSLTGTNADEWLAARAGTEGLVALAVARVVARSAGGAEAARIRELLVPYTPEWAAERTGVEAERIRRLGEEIAAAERPVALPPGAAGRGSAATDAHVAVALLNHVAGATGETVRLGAGPRRSPTATLAEIRELVRRMGAGEIDTLVVAGPDPVHALPASVGFGEALESVATVVSLSSHPDDTTVRAGWVLPSHHELESWGDAELRPGVWALGQPAMRPVFDTRQREDVLMRLAGAARGDGSVADLFGAGTFAGYLQAAWREKWDAARRDAPGGVGDPAAARAAPFERWWRESLRRGGRWRATLEAPAGASLSSEVARHSFDVPGTSGGEDFDLVVYPTGHLYDGRGANRGWMQELPDPVTKVVWTSWVEMHPDTAEPLGLEDGDEVEVVSPVGRVRAPVYLYRGIRPDTVAIPMGQGHEAYGRNAAGRGVNPLDLLPAETERRSGALLLAGARVGVSATGRKRRLVNAQGSDVDHEREIAEMLGVEEARARIDAHEIDLGSLVEAAWDSDPRSPYRWGMTMDLNACTGCGACVTACYAENNLPVVGEERFGEGREMSWLRVERYYEETADGGFQTVHEPMMCQHCGDAPCEPVCPVYATYHSPEGLNVQVYNRCVGTRYCSNNCPYKVRRFNWFTYDFPHPLDLQLNPDVTVREKGVMEKCTFCVQRINRAKVEAKEEGRLVGDGEVRTACQSACPTDAIAFGNLKDPNSKVSRIARGARAYHVLGELNTRPAVTYLKDVTHAEMAHASGHGDGHGDGEHGEGGHAGGPGDGAGDPGSGADDDGSHD